jgi:hypothetical protein
LAAQDDTAGIAEWRATMRDAAPDVPYEHRLRSLDVFGLHEIVYRTTHTPRYEIMTRVPVRMPVAQPAHDLPEYVAECVSRLNN